MAITCASRLFTLQDIGSRLLHIVAWSQHSILSMALLSHVSSKHLSALDTGCSSVACSLPFAEGCPTCGNVVLGPGIGDSSLDIAEWYSCCTVLSMPLPWDVAVIPTLSISGQRLSGTTNGVPCIASLGMWVQRSLCASGASLESWACGSSHSCGSMTSTSLLSHGAEATTCLDNWQALSCGGDAPQGLSPASTVGSRSLALWELSFPACFVIRWASLGLVQIIAHAVGGGTPMCSLCRLCFFVDSTSHLLHTTQKSVMDTADFGTHLSC